MITKINAENCTYDSQNSIICIDSDSSISVISVKSSNSSVCISSIKGTDVEDQCIEIISSGNHSSSEESNDACNLNGFEIFKRLYSAMNSIRNCNESERHEKFWNSKVVQDLKIYLWDFDSQLRSFIKNMLEPDSLVLRNIPKKIWKFLRDQSYYYDLALETCNNHLIIHRRKTALIPQDWSRHLELSVFHFIDNIRQNFLGSNQNDTEFDPVSCIGYQILIKMGWKPGTPLGLNDGILEPITLLNGRYSKSGLGNQDFF